MTPATSIQPVPWNWVRLAAVFLSIAALAGLYLGVSRSLGAHDLPSDSDTLSAVPNVTNAKPLASDPIADDAHIRAIARDEAQAVMKSAPPRPKPATPKADDDAASSPTDATADLNAAAAAGGAPPRASSPRVIYPSTGADSSTRLIPVTPRSSSRAPTTTNPYPPSAPPPY